MTPLQKKVIVLHNLLRLVFGFALLWLGVDKWLGLLTDWQKYLSPLSLSIVETTVSALTLVAVIEIVAGILILIGQTKIGGNIAAVWFLLVAFNLILLGGYADLVLRQFILSAGAIILAQLGEIVRSIRRI
ncbi:MAG: DoxX family membrane protein [Candidatus Komeilibacteria bacterium]|nr:DoxX family membrane protein [Candidatus Komeilibacteria bacterium]